MFGMTVVVLISYAMEESGMSTKSAKVAISVPKELLRKVERERRASGETRSAFFARAVAEFLAHQRAHKDIEAHIRSYQIHPEEGPEVEAISALGLKTLAREKWE